MSCSQTRIPPLKWILALTAGLTMLACDDGGGPTKYGTLTISTSTGGNAPDPDGYQLVLNGARTVALDPTDSAEVVLAAGRHDLRLLGVAEHCTVPVGTSREVVISEGNRTDVEFAITCTATGARITVESSGIDIDRDGYRIVVDDSTHGMVPSNGTAVADVLPGLWTIRLVGLAPNCSIEGSEARTVTVLEAAVVPVEFSVVCVASHGVVGVVVSPSGMDTDGEYTATIDQQRLMPVGPEGPTYWSAVPVGDHQLALNAPDNCVVTDGPQVVTLTGGSLVRDTVEATFSVTCETRRGNLRITTHTTGTVPSDPDYPTRYQVTLWAPDFYYGEYPYPLGTVEPNGTLTTSVEPGSYSRLEVDNVPDVCTPAAYNVSPFNVEIRDTLEFTFSFTCPP